MERIAIGESGLTTSRIGLGTWAIGLPSPLALGIIAGLTEGLFGRIGGARATENGVPGPPTVSRWRRLARSFNEPAGRTMIAYIAVVAVFIAWLEPISGKRYLPRPAVPAPVFRDLQTLADRLPANARMWTWWDLGFAIVDTTRFGVYHDGAAQYTAQTNVIAATFVHSDPRVMHHLIGFVDREGNRGIHRLAAQSADFDDLTARMVQAAPPGSDVPIYVLFTADMVPKYSSMRYLATPTAAARPVSGAVGIWPLDCAVIAEQLQCGLGHADLRTGALEDGGRVATTRARGGFAAP